MKLNTNTKISDCVLYLIPALLGTAAFFLIVGPRAIDPTNISWLANGDPAQHFLGWNFFRHANWSFPLGANPNYGLELGNAIVFSDSNPFLAFLFKPFSAFLPEPFQYFGIWLLACFILQAWFSWKLTGLISESMTVRALAAGLYIFSPPMILKAYEHLSLAGHFLIVAGLYLTFNEKLKNRTVAWCTLLALAALTHAYLFAMVAPLWAADLSWKTITKKLSIRKSVFELSIITAVTCVTCWQAGYFTAGSGVSAVGFGYHRMNLLSIFDANSWSYSLKDIPTNPGEGEGFNFLGLGIIFLFVGALPTLVSGRVGLGNFIRKFPLLLLPLAGFALFALSNKVGVGLFSYEIPLPDRALAAANVFRASGRMFWPVFYVLIFTVIFLVVRGYDKRTAIMILSLALFIQIVDSRPGWSGIRNNSMTIPSTAWATPLINPFWSEAASRYTKVRWIQPAFETPNWKVFSAYASTHRMATDAVYLARISDVALENAKQSAFEVLNSGKYESDVLYVLDDKSFRKAAMNIDSATDLLAHIDGFNVIAPGWKKCTSCRQIETEVRLSDLLSPISFGQRVIFNNYSSGETYLGAGWSSPETWGTWSESSSATVVLPLEANLASTLLIEAKPWLSPSRQKQDVNLTINGIPVGKIMLNALSDNLVSIEIPETVKQLGLHTILKLNFHFPDAVRPVDIGVSPERRKLGIGLLAITVR